MPKFVLRCKNAPNYFLETQYGKELVFTDKIEQAYDFTACNIENAQAYFAVNNTQLAHSLFEVYEVSAPRCVINILNTNLFVMTVHDTISFTEDIKCALEKPERLMIQVFDKIKDKVKSKLQLVKL